MIGLISFTANVLGAIVTLIFYSENSFITFIVTAVQFVAYLTAVVFLFALSLVSILKSSTITVKVIFELQRCHTAIWIEELRQVYRLFYTRGIASTATSTFQVNTLK